MEYSEVLNAISTVFEMEQLMQAIAALKTAMYKTEARVYEETFRAEVPLHLADLMRRHIPEDKDKGAEYLAQAFVDLHLGYSLVEQIFEEDFLIYQYFQVQL